VGVQYINCQQATNRTDSQKLLSTTLDIPLQKGIISTNAIELELLSTMKIHPVVNVSRVCRYKDQVEGQKKKQPVPVKIEGEEEYEVEKILNKKKFKGRD